MPNPALIHNDAMKALFALHKSTQGKGVSDSLLHLIDLRVSQINGCSFCVDMHARECRQAGESDERLFAVAAWREAPWFTDAERAALLIAIANINVWNRLNVATRQPAGQRVS